MKPQKLIWTKSDTLQSMHQKMLALLGNEVECNESPYTGFNYKTTKIASVSEKLELFFMPNYLDEFIQFSEGDSKYFLKDSGFNYQLSEESKGTWCLCINCKIENENSGGFTETNTYKLGSMVGGCINKPPDAEQIEKMKTWTVHDPACPFMFYEENFDE